MPMPEPHHHAGHSSRAHLDADELLKRVGLKAGNVLVDAGCGDGHVSIAASPVVGPAGTIWALDNEAPSLDKLARESYVKGINNIKILNADISEKLPLQDGAADMAMMVNVLHGLASESKAEPALRELRRVLKPGGRLVIVDFEKKFGLFGPPKDVRLSPDETEALASRAGFRKARQFEPASSLYAIIFT